MALTEGIFTEPACALPLAAVKKYPEHFSGRRCLFILTGTGLKDTGVVTRNALVSPVLNPDPEQILEFIASGYLALQQARWGKPKPEAADPSKLDQEHRRLYEQYLEQIKRKGKQLSEHESEVLQELVLQEQLDLELPVQVVDYDIQVRKNSLVQAFITFQLQDGSIVQQEATGVGPVDAVLRCAKRVTDTLLPLQLVHHSVEVLSGESHSLVVVSMKLRNLKLQEMKFQDMKTPDEESFIEVKSASPDTIEAALHAFIKGLAIALHQQKKV
jgi:threonine synthase